MIVLAAFFIACASYTGIQAMDQGLIQWEERSLLDQLPPEIPFTIFGMIGNDNFIDSIRLLSSCRLVCRYWNGLFRDEPLLKSFFNRVIIKDLSTEHMQAIKDFVSRVLSHKNKNDRDLQFLKKLFFQVKGGDDLYESFDGDYLIDICSVGGGASVECLLRLGAPKDYEQIRPGAFDFIGQRALHSAARVGNYEAAQILLAAGVEKDAHTSRGCSPIHVAVMNGHVEVVKVLLSYFVDTQMKVVGDLYFKGMNAVEIAQRKFEDTGDKRYKKIYDLLSSQLQSVGKK